MIFNKDNKGNEEIKALLGFLNSSVQFKNLITYVRLAQREIIYVIGSEVYKIAEDYYLSDDYKVVPVGDETDEAKATRELKETLVELVQMPVILHAYRRSVPSFDLIHSDKGRQMTSSTSEKSPFEWMIDKDNQNLLDLAHEHTDVLLEFLEDNIKNALFSEAWGECKERLLLNKLLINNAYTFDRYFPIGKSRFLFITIAPFIQLAQDKYIRPCFTADHWALIMEERLDGDLQDAPNPQDGVLDPSNQELLPVAQRALAFLAFAYAIERLPVEIIGKQVFKGYIDNSVSLRNNTGEKRTLTAQLLMNDGKLEVEELMRMIGLQNAVTTGVTYETVLPLENSLPEDMFLSI